MVGGRLCQPPVGRLLGSWPETGFEEISTGVASPKPTSGPEQFPILPVRRPRREAANRSSEAAIALVFVCRGQSSLGFAIDHLQTKLAASLILPLPLYTASCG